MTYSFNIWGETTVHAQKLSLFLAVQNEGCERQSVERVHKCVVHFGIIFPFTYLKFI
jgi:hypothetical protein